LSEWNIYLSCNDLPFEIFKKCRVEKTYHLLKLNPADNIPAEILDRAWVYLYSEFCIISEDEHVAALVADLAHMRALESRILRIKLYCAYLQQSYNPYIAAKLKEAGYGYPFSQEGYLADVEKVIRLLKNDEHQLSTLVKSVNDRTDVGDEEEQKAAAYAMFDKQIDQIEQAFKVPVDTTKLTASRYATKLKGLKEYYRALEEKHMEANG